MAFYKMSITPLKTSSSEVDLIFDEIETLLAKVKDVQQVINDNLDRSVESSKYIQ